MKWPPEFQVSAEIDDDGVVEEQRRVVAALTDEELLAAAAQACRELLLIGDPARLANQMPPEMWELDEFEVVPASPELQVLLLWHLAAESLGLAAFALERRASATALAQVRVLCDAYCLLRWLKEPEDEMERKARTVGFVLAEIDDQKKVDSDLASTPEQVIVRQREVEYLMSLQEELTKAARENGVEPERPPARAAALYDAYFEPGYRVYRLLSDAGSHVGLRFWIEFFRESGSRTSYRFDFEKGGLRQRAFWLTAAYFVFAAFTEVVAWYLGWEEGMRAEVVGHYRTRLGLIAETQRRYGEHWLAGSD
jgi:hypothetical protein